MKNLIKRIIVLYLLIGLCGAGCTRKVFLSKRCELPDAAVAAASVAKIDSLLGYSFQWTFGRKRIGLIPEMKGELEGKVSVPDRIYISGTWKTGDVIEKIQAYSIEGKEYTFDTDSKRWKRGKGSSYPDPFEHLKLVLSFGEFTFIKVDIQNKTECYLFSFKPNVYFLDPIESSEPEGLLWVAVQSGIPVRVKVKAKKNLINWNMVLSDINTFASLSVPFRSLSFRVHDIAENDITVIVERCMFLGYSKPDRVQRNGDVVFSIKAENISDTLLTALLKKGDIQVFVGTWPKDPIYKLRENSDLVSEQYGEGAQLFFERGIITKPVIAIKRILSRDAFITFDLVNDLLGKYSLYGTVTSGMADSLREIIAAYSDEPAVIVVDDVAVLITIIRDAWLVENRIPIVQGMEQGESTRIFARLREEPLRRNYDFSRAKEEE